MGLGMGPGGSLFGGVQSIVGNGHMGHPSPEQNDRHVRKHYFPATSLAGGKNS